MQIHNLQPSTKRPKKKTIGRGGKKGTYSGRGNKGQKARSGGNVNPLFEGGRSTLVDHMKKKRGFKSLVVKNVVIKLEMLEKKFKDGDIINIESLVSSKLVRKSQVASGVKVLGTGKLTKKFTFEKGILFSTSAKAMVEKAGGTIS